MKKKLVGLAFLFVLLLAFILLRSSWQEPWHPNVQLTFTGFVPGTTITNVAAEFLVTGVPKGDDVTFLLQGLNRKEGTGWKPYEMELGPFDVELICGNTSSSNSTPLLAHVPMETTNMPSQIIIEVKRHPQGFARWGEELRARWAEYKGRDSLSEWKGPGFFITNETVVTGP